MIEFHPAFETPSEDRPLWRYLDIGKYLSLLSTSQLHFSHADSFEDPWEGALPSNYFEAFEPELKVGMAVTFKSYSRANFINCWHLSEYESQAMWRVYGSRESNIALFTHMRELRNSLSGWTEDKIYCGRVKYIDYTKESIPPSNLLCPWLHKRLGFEFESEVRLILQKFISNPGQRRPPRESEFINGVDIKIDLKKLIKRVYVSPRAKQWYVNAVRSVTEKFDLDPMIVEQSNLDQPPTFPDFQSTAPPDPSSPARDNASG